MRDASTFETLRNAFPVKQGRQSSPMDSPLRPTQRSDGSVLTFLVRQEWAKAAAPQLRRYLAVEAELSERAREAARWAQVLEAGEVIDLVGRRPDGLASRSRWRQALETVASHMLRWGSQPGDPRQAQVQELEAARQRQARRVERALAEVTRHRALDQAMDRDIGPSL